MLRALASGSLRVAARARVSGARAPACRTLCKAAEEPASTPPPPPDDAELRLQVLRSALAVVPETGWTVASLSAGAESCGLSPMAHGLCPRGPVELVEFFSAQCDAKLVEELEMRREELEALEVHNRLLLAIQSRLKMVAPHSGNWAEALALRALPTNLPHTSAASPAH